MRDYLSSMAYVDREMRRLISAIESQAPDTYVMLFGDHCPPYIGKEIAPEIFIPSAMIRDNIGYEFTPLYIITPDKRNMGIDTVCATMVDIGPTVLAASGIACTYLSDGADLLDTAALTDEVWYMNKTLNRRQLVSALTK
jgi:phosphoglycerol transferase MdoB-like AlkP superfamily enzyme